MSQTLDTSEGESIIVNNMTSMFHWFTQHPLSAAAVLFGGATLAVALFTYVHDYKMLIREGMEAGR
jgi:hypothetical protein